MLGSIFSIIAGIGFVWKVVEVLIAKMTIFILYCFGSVFFFSLGVILFFLWAKQRCDAHIEKKDKEKMDIQLELVEERKQYNELYEKTKPPSEVIAIKEYRIAELADGTSKYPSLRLRLDVINRSYYNFKPKAVRIVCKNNEEEVGEDEWREGMATGAKGFSGIKKRIDIGSKLPPNGESYINFKVPIEKKYNHLARWDLEGYVEYESEEELKSVEIYTNHYLTKHAEEDIEQKLNKAIGGDSK